MSRLLLDLGNTRMKWALCVPGGAGRPAAREWPEGASRAAAVLESIRLFEPESVAVCSVLGSELERELLEACPVPIRFVRPADAEAFGVRLGYDDPDTLGVDRAVGLVAAWARWGRACILVDCGTAVTVDALDHRGRHRGGVILPGIRAMLTALGTRTRGVNVRVAAEPACPPVLARDTRGAVEAGACRAVVAGVEAVVAEMRETLGGAAAVMVCGGDAHWLARHTRLAVQTVPDLVLEGLAMMVDA